MRIYVYRTRAAAGYNMEIPGGGGRPNASASLAESDPSRTSSPVRLLTCVRRRGRGGPSAPPVTTIWAGPAASWSHRLYTRLASAVCYPPPVRLSTQALLVLLASLVRERNLLTPQCHAGSPNSMRVHERPKAAAKSADSRSSVFTGVDQFFLDSILHFDVAPGHVACFLWVNSLTSRVPFASVTGATRFLTTIDPDSHCMCTFPRIQSYR
jgi:hypothetical protein